MFVLGVDAGGTSTRAAISTADGRCRGVGRAGSGNPTASGAVPASDAVFVAVRQAVASAGVALHEVAVIVIAMAGHDAHDGIAAALTQRLASHGFRGVLDVESDLLAMYLSGTVAPVGYAVVCGTGASAVRVQGGRIVAVCDGLGWLLGDRGSGFWIGRSAALAVADQLDGVGPVTALTGLVLHATGVQHDPAARTGEGRPAVLQDLLRALYARRSLQLAEFAPLVFDAADAQDPVACAILQAAGEHLTQTFAQVLTLPGPVVAGGSILSRSGVPRNMLRARVDALAGSGALLLVDSGVAGATVLALRAAGVGVDEPMLARLRAGISSG